MKSAVGWNLINDGCFRTLRAADRFAGADNYLYQFGSFIRSCIVEFEIEDVEDENRENSDD